MIRYKIYQNQQKKGLNAGKWFARAVSDETFDLPPNYQLNTIINMKKCYAHSIRFMPNTKS